MELSPKLIYDALLSSFLTGLFLGLFRDGCRFLSLLWGRTPLPPSQRRQASKKKKHGRQLEEALPQKQKKIYLYGFLPDLCSVLLFTLSILAISFAKQNGRIRSFVPILLLTGFLVYRVTLHRLIRPLTEMAARMIRRIFACFLAPFLRLFQCGLARYQRIRKKAIQKRAARLEQRRLQKEAKANENSMKRKRSEKKGESNLEPK